MAELDTGTDATELDREAAAEELETGTDAIELETDDTMEAEEVAELVDALDGEDDWTDDVRLDVCEMEDDSRLHIPKPLWHPTLQ